MTGKRFTVIDHNEWSEGDIIYYDDGEEMGWMDVCDKLNALNDENEQLKQKIHYLKIVCRNELDDETLKQVMGSLGDFE